MRATPDDAQSPQASASTNSAIRAGRNVSDGIWQETRAESSGVDVSSPDTQTTAPLEIIDENMGELNRWSATAGIPEATLDRMLAVDLHGMIVADPLELPVSGVYFLVCNTELVYIGKSENVRARVVGHLMARKHLFNRVAVLPCSEPTMDGYEKTLIRALKPKDNRLATKPLLEHVIRERLGFASCGGHIEPKP